MRKNGNQFSETTKIHEIVKDPYEALLSTKSKRLVDELSNDEVQQIRTLGPEGIVKLPRLSSVGEKTSREIYDYFSSTVFQQNTNSETHLEQNKPSHILTLSELSKDELELILTPLDYLNLKPRIRSGLKNSGISYLGQIASLDRSEFLKLPNAGKSSWNEIFAIVQKYDLLLYANIEWPGHEFVKDLVSKRQLDVGKPLAIGSSAATTIEQEARDIFAQALSPIQFKVLAEGLGLVMTKLV